MGLKHVLRSLRLVELDEREEAARPAAAGRGDPQAASRPAVKPARLDDIVAEVEAAPEVDEKRVAPASAGGALAFPSFAEVYAAAGIAQPAHGFTAFKVLEILEAPEFAGLEAKAKASALLGFLRRNPTGAVEIADVVKDAVRRDQALDKFEEFLRAKLAERAAKLDAENAVLQAEIDDVVRRNRARMDENRAALEQERRRLDEWLAGKRAEEQRLSAAIEPFVERNTVTTPPEP